MDEHCNPYNIAGAGYDAHDFVSVNDKGDVIGPADECLRCGKPTPEKAERDAAYRHADEACRGPWWPVAAQGGGDEGERLAEPDESPRWACDECGQVDDNPALPDLLEEARHARPSCRFGRTEHDGSRFCHEHAGRVHAGSPTHWRCDKEGGVS